jgi:hypothetical protein
MGRDTVAFSMGLRHSGSGMRRMPKSMAAFLPNIAPTPEEIEAIVKTKVPFNHSPPFIKLHYPSLCFRNLPFQILTRHKCLKTTMVVGTNTLTVKGERKNGLPLKR